MSDYQWHFVENPNLNGPNDAIHEKFRQNAYYSIVRESIQNSMDVQLDHSKPVVVKFETLNINQAEHPELFTIKEHIQSCLEYFKNDIQAQDLFNGMLNYLETNSSIKILKVSDFNTQGMKYEKDNPTCPFTSFMSQGISSKPSGAGGSYGFGKGAYYVPSKLRTILVSTKYDDDKVAYQGRTRLSSHKHDGAIRDYRGDFRIDEYEPVIDEDNIGLLFRREKLGTDVFILGMEDDPNYLHKMVVSVLNNFWLAIHQDRLDVFIKTENEEIEFDERNLEKHIEDYFEDEIESAPISALNEWNPAAYYKAVKYKEQTEDYLFFEKELPTLGKVKLYVYRNEGLQNRISFMRKPAMTVNKVTNNILSGYAAVFLCDNDDGNEILRQMENPAHNEWNAQHVRNVPKEKMYIYRNARSEINDFIRETLKSISGTNDSSRMEVAGLSEFLTIPEELLDDREELSGEADSLVYGSSSKEDSDGETGLITTSNTKINLRVNESAKNSVNAPSKNDGNEIDLFSGGGEENDSDNPNPKPSKKPGNELDEGKLDEHGNQLAYIPVKFRAAAVNDEGEITHNLIIQSDKDYPNVTLDIKSGTDNGANYQLNVLESNKGQGKLGQLENISLSKGRNIIQVRFDDNIKHSLKLSAYEVE